MAEVKDGINGKVKGRVGNAVFYTMNGKNIVRSLPQINKHKKPTLNQERQRQRMSLAQELLKPLKDLIKLTFASLAENSAPYHVAKSYNMRHAIIGEFPNQEIDWTKVYLSAGSVEKPSECIVQKRDGGLHFNWSKGEGKHNDTLVVMAYNPESNRLEYRFTGISRQREDYFWDVALQDMPMHVWVAFRRQDETDISDSLYLGVI
ncbi:DUF6266 family protein [Carboxylicivirga sp. RSCT41]|uniref:DUF6266 family protein n=1 Tax=Carboxylicivirga agarovorans TaxID=3417570 RepID=UPI003D3351A6